ncbi:DUF5682 family protein [Nocardiopsis sp. MG754419]|uniref:DUF5682 family protein n=1 Tax=Nocardiopsis sp. MG754419 TaxID=2259865 RepID=UPI001BA62828|nr:DUF5682 family protein [Nocardiopsis sp. MG754419]MBR8745072.1 hypothetical protein [Nocardiopsis sp. MG754419]
MGRPRLDTSKVSVLGVRHHGPGSARAVRAALDEIEPDLVLIEGPPEADAITSLVGGLEPPVALLVHLADTPRPGSVESRQGWAFWPFASFSPEWAALRHAHDHDVPVRFCDLPAAHTLADRLARAEEAEREKEAARAAEQEAASADAPQDASEEAARDDALPADAEGSEGADPESSPGEPTEEPRVRLDPLGVLAEAAGYDDAERWWDDVVEQRADGEPSPFPAIADAMAAVRAESGPESERDARREAYMRQTLRAALKQGYERIAVVCGAWHAPALRDLSDYPIKGDTALLKGLPKVKTTATWVPWTHGRLATASGYGAGVTSPGWYHHLFTAPDRPVHRWLTDAARLLREEGQQVSSSHVIEGVRLAESLAVLRGRPLAGLNEVAEATTAVLCEGEQARAALVHGRMVIGERLGSVPADTPMVPLQHDLKAAQKRLRLKPEAFDRDLDLDLRKEGQRERSVLLHRLRLIGVEWGVPRTPDSGGRGTFRESWRLRWEPEMDVALIEAAPWGTTVGSAATARVVEIATEAELPTLTALTEQCLLAELGEALPDVLALLTDRAATDSDITHLMSALPPLARSSRYGDVRGTDSRHLRSVAQQILARVRAGLVPAVRGLDDAAAAEFVTALDRTHNAATLLDDDLAAWLDSLADLAVRDSVPGRIAGRVNRILSDHGRVEASELRRRLGLVMSPGTDPTHAVSWLEGFLQGSGLILVHDEHLLGMIDTWLLGLPEERFTAILPLLRRTFGAFDGGERQEIGSAVTRIDGGRTTEIRVRRPVDADRAAPAVAAVLGLLERSGA